jgi:transcriptional regulator with XRE-family HTH domain
VPHLYRLLGKRLAYFRLQAGLTQEQLAEKTDYSVDFIGLVERGINAPTIARLQDLATTLGVEVWQLFYPAEKADSSSPSKSASRTATALTHRKQVPRRRRAKS